MSKQYEKLLSRHRYDVCILGATGAVGEAMLAILEQR